MSTISTDGVSASNGHSKSEEVLYINRVVLENFGAFPLYEFRPGRHLTLIEGDNAEGKTTIENALDNFFVGGNNAKLIRNGEDQARMIVELSNGIQFEKILRRAGKATLKEIHPEFGAINAAQTHLERMISNYFAVNPAKLLDADPKDRAEYLLSKLPIPVPTEQLQSIMMPGTAIPEGHALKVLPVLRKDLEQRRKAKRQQKEDKEGEVAGLRKSLPPGEPEDVTAQLADARRTFDDAKEAKRIALTDATLEYTRKLDAVDRSLGDFIQNKNSALEQEIARLRAECQTEIDAERLRMKTEADSVLTGKDAELAKIAEHHDPAIEMATAEVARLDASSEQAIRDKHTRELLARAAQQEQLLTVEWKGFDLRIKQLDALSDSLTAELPIPGLTIGDDGDLWVDGVTWTQVNLARRIDVLFQLGELSTGDLNFIFFDDLEHLSSKSFAIFKDRALRSTKQTIANRVADVPLTVTTFEPEVEEVAG